MVEMVSPGVYVTETDMSEIVPTVSSSTAVFGGDFTKGVVEAYTEITSVDDLIEFYGLPTDLNYNDWYQCYNFLQYGNRLLVSRACNLNGYPIFTNGSFVGINSQEGYGISNYGTFGYGIGDEVEVVLLDRDIGLKKGDIVGFTDVTKSPSKVINKEETERYFVIDVSEVVTSLGEFYGLRLDRPLEIPAKYRESYATVADFYLEHKYPVIIREHHNGSCEALEYDLHSMDSKTDSQTQQVTEIPMLVTWKVSSIRYTSSDQVTGTKETTQKFAYTVPVFVPDYLEKTDRVVQNYSNIDGFDYYFLGKREPKTPDNAYLFKYNKKVLNPSDWDYMDSSGSINFSTSNSKLKFFSRTPGTASTLYSISIALPNDFASNDKDHIGNHCTRYVAEGIPVDSLFEFAPAAESAQIAVVIYDIVNQEVKEKYLCSLDPDEKDNYNNSMFIEKVINRSSNLVYVKCNTSTPATIKTDKYVSTSDYGDWVVNGKEEVPNVGSYTLVADWNGKYYGQLLNFSCASDSTIQKDDLLNAYEVFENKDLIDVDIVISNELDNGESALALAEKRLDCIAFMGIPYEYFEKENLGILAVAKRSPEATANIVKYRNKINYNTDRMALVANYKYQYDRYNDTYRWVNFAGDVAGLRARTNQDLAPWWASAGLNRGQLKNVVKLAYNPNQTQRNTLYTNGINPIVDFPGQGIVLWGQKTMLDKSSSFDRVNVRSLFNCIERALAKMSKYQVMEFNDTFTRNRIISIMKPYLATVQADRGIQDFEVICDTTNNTPDIISRNQLVVDIYIKPVYVAEMIHLNFVNCGVSDFSSIISSSSD